MNYTIYDAYFGKAKGPKSKNFSKILLIMVKQGKQSKTSLTKILEKDYSVISPSVDSLLDHKAIQKLDFSKKRKRKKTKDKEIYYYLTEKGLKFLIDENNVKFNLDDLWNVAFSICDNKKYFKNRIRIEEIFDYYAKKKFNVSKRFFVNFVSTTILDILQNLKKSNPTLISESLSFLQKLSITNLMQPHEFLDSMNLNKIERSYYEEMLIPELSFNGLIYYWNVRNKENKIALNIGISHLGLLVVFDDIVEKIRNNEITIPTNDIIQRAKDGSLNNEFTKTIRSISIKQKHLFPFIFNNWKKLRKIVPNGEYDLFSIMIYPYVEDKSVLFDSTTRQLENTIFNLQYSMEIEFRKRIDQIFYSGMKAIRKIAYSKKCTKYLFGGFDVNDPSMILSFLEFGGRSERISIEYSVDVGLRTIEAEYEGHYEHWEFDNKLKKLLGKKPTFFSQHEKEYLESSMEKQDLIKLLKHYEEPVRELSRLYNIHRAGNDFMLRFSHEISKNSDLEPLISIMSFHFFIILQSISSEKDWLDFFALNENKEVKEWFNEWMKYLINFEKENLNNLESLKIMN